MRLRLLSLALVFLGAAAPPDPVTQSLQFTLTPDLSDGELTGLEVHIRFNADPSGTTNFGWGKGWAGERKLWQWARGLKVAGATAVEKSGDGHWRIKSAPSKPLTVSYHIASAYDHDPTVDDSDQPRPVNRANRPLPRLPG